MEGTSFPNSSADGLKKHVMKVFEEATKDCEDKVLKEIRDYDSLNKYAIQLFNILANNTLAEEAKELFKPCSDSAVLPDVAVFTIVIRAYAYAGKTKAALKVYQQMIATGVDPTSCTYTILITSLATDSSSDVNFVGYAKKYFLEMLDKGMKPHSASYMTVFNAIACRESVEKAREFLEQIQAKGFTPESKVHHFEEGHLTEAMNAMKLYDDLVNKTTDKKMQKVFRKWRTAGGGLAKKESLEMFGALIDDGYVDEANELFKRICETGVYPMVTNHTSVIQAYLKFGKTKGALEAYRGMLASGVAPNSYTYTVLIKGLTIDPNFCGDAKKCILDMMDRGIRPNPATYTAVIEGFAKQEDEAAEEEAKDLVDVMMSEGFVPNAKAMMEVLKGRPTPLIRRVINIVLSKLKG
ncbi:pentatricopeptide repeat-containing protein At1g06710, mitochondrial [Rosa chinensis]|uniref:pentatricopeptide repeat-containing protein At1g06710, mitochondrial n=1 Tax=Rosa chinensis TaxID=74649 RepID=UPI000D08E904|nr:pentatricopeptide repeat-containing protein At1g06710, mitochondrial [Rosa chinensis]XP_040367949.1 pentatricopeptide repeat-containing protein At1g06710, mitochondrial [Rosa chinensis]